MSAEVFRCPACGGALADVRWVGPGDPPTRLVGDCDGCDEVVDVTDEQRAREAMRAASSDELARVACQLAGLYPRDFLDALARVRATASGTVGRESPI